MNGTNIKIIFSTLIGTIAYYLGGVDELLTTLIVVVFIDFITGILKAIYLKKLSSAIGYKGISRKVGYFLIIALSFVIGNLIGNTIPIREITIMFFIANEGISILENASAMDIPYTDKLKTILEQLKTKENDKNDKNE